MTSNLIYQVALPPHNITAPRRLSQDLLNFLSDGQQGVSEGEKLGSKVYFGSFFQEGDDADSLTGAGHQVTEEDLYNLSNATDLQALQWGEKPSDHFGVFQSSPPFSQQLATLLPSGHPYRQAHGIADSVNDKIQWLIADPDLKPDEKSLVEKTLLESDAETRASKWATLIEKFRNLEWGWHEIRTAVMQAVEFEGDLFVDSLHPREAGVVRSIAGGMSTQEIAEKFGVDNARIVKIYAEAGEKIRQRFEQFIDEMQTIIEKKGIVDLQQLAGVAKDFDTHYGTPWQFTRLLLLFCSGKTFTTRDQKTYVLSNQCTLGLTSL
jgi:hypothetical protein